MRSNKNTPADRETTGTFHVPPVTDPATIRAIEELFSDDPPPEGELAAMRATWGIGPTGVEDLPDRNAPDDDTDIPPDNDRVASITVVDNTTPT